MILIKVFKGQTALILGICFLFNSSFATYPNDEDSKPLLTHSNTSLITSENCDNYTNTIKTLFDQGKYERLLEFTKNDPLPGDSMSPINIAEISFHHLYFRALTKLQLAHDGLSSTTTSINNEKCINYCLEAITDLDSYLKLYGAPNDQAAHGHRPYLKRGELFTVLTFLSEKKVSDPNELDNRIIQALESLDCAEKLASRNGTSIQEQLDLKESNFLHYCTLFQRLSLESMSWKVNCIEKAQAVYKFTKQYQSYLNQDRLPSLGLRQMELKLKMMRNNFKKYEVISNKGLSANIRRIKLSNIEESNLELYNEIQNLQTAAASPDSRIKFAHEELRSFFKRNLTASNETNPLSLIQNIENQIQKQLTQLNHPSTLEDIYEYYYNLFQKPGMTAENDITLCAIIPFIQADLLDEANDRINIIASVERKEKGKWHLLTRVRKAIVNSMVGDHEELLKLKKEANAARLQKEEAKKMTKKNQHIKIVDQIKAAQQNNQKYSSKANPNSKQTPAKTRRANANSSFVTPSDNELNDFEPLVSEPWVSRETEKKEKIERHEAAEHKRTEEAQQKEAAAESNTSPEKNELAPIVSPQPLKTIKECYHLTTTAERVDNEIVGGRWEITRAQLETYFRVLGCEIKEDQGKGVHQKVSLPKSLSIYKDGKLITIINYDFGGALTLPNWDKSYRDKTVPNYLRSLILKAREKLVSLYLAAENAAEKED